MIYLINLILKLMTNLQTITLAEDCVRTDMIWHIMSINKYLTLDYLNSLDPYGLEPEKLLPDCHPSYRDYYKSGLDKELKEQ